MDRPAAGTALVVIGAVKALAEREAMGDVASDEQLLESLRIFYEYQWMLLGHLYRNAAERFGQSGVDALCRGIWQYGYYRGQKIRDSVEGAADERSAYGLVRNWDAADWIVASDSKGIAIEGTPTSLRLTLSCMAGSEYFAERATLEPLEAFWTWFLPGLAAGYAEDATAGHSSAAEAGTASWTVWFDVPGEHEADDSPPVPEALRGRQHYLRVARKTAGIVAALEMYVGRELLADFDASGEEALRDACYAYGAERSTVMRERHLAAGIPLNLESMVGKLADDRDPMGAVFASRGEAYFSPGLTEFDCTYCPLAEVWAEEGKQGLELGYIFDMELHRGLLETYYPGAVVRWDALKTRGDSLCRFRFSIPELLTPEEERRLSTRRPESPGAVPRAQSPARTK